MPRCILVALWSTSLLLAQQPPTPPAQNPVFSVSSTLVQVDAEVTDSHQHHVTNLAADDFEVTLDGKIQPITNFTYVHLDDSTPNGLPPGAPADARIKPEYVRRSIVIVVDDLGISFEDMYFVRRALHQFVDQRMQPGDLLAIWQTGRSNSVFQQLTSDKHLLSAAIDALHWNPQGKGLLQAMEQDEKLLARQHLGAPTPGEEDEKDYLSADLASAALNTLAELTNELADVGGRKAVVLFSNGLPVGQYGKFATVNQHTAGSPEDEEFRENMRKLIDRANRSGAVIYTIDARGLEYVDSKRVMSVAESQAPLVALAEQTGGFATVNSNGLADAMDRIREDQLGYYLIGFKAPQDVSTKPVAKGINFYSLRVRLKRRGLHIRSRAGFWGETDDAARPDTSSPAAQMRLAALSLFNRSDIHVRLTALYTRTSDARPVVRNLLYIDPRDISFKSDNKGKHHAGLDILVTGSAPGPNSFQTVSRRLDIAADDDMLQHLRSDGILLVLDVPLKGAGPYQIRAAVRDANSAALGSAGQFVDIPNLKKVHLAFTTPLLRDISAPRDSPDASEVLREFHSGTDLSVVAMLETDRDQTENLPARDFDASLQLLSNGKPVLDTRVPVAVVQGRNVHALKAEIRLNQSLPVGQYYLRATATDNSGKTQRSTSTWVDFEIVP